VRANGASPLPGSRLESSARKIPFRGLGIYREIVRERVSKRESEGGRSNDCVVVAVLAPIYSIPHVRFLCDQELLQSHHHAADDSEWR